MFSHSLFSLPFALIGLLVAAHGRPHPDTAIWVVIGFMGGRNSANALNRIVDKAIDRRNPRTATRHLPAETIGSGEAWAVTGFFLALMILAAFMLNPTCVYLLPLGGLLIGSYSFMKRFTSASHLVLGAACAAAPIGGWVAVTGRLDPAVLLLGTANALWVAGFDVIYATQDVEFDRRDGLYSIPAVYGVAAGLTIARIMHALVIPFLAGFGILIHGGPLYYVGVVAAALLLAYQHGLVSPAHLKKVTIASYSVNQVLSVVFFLFVVFDLFLRVRN